MNIIHYSEDLGKQLKTEFDGSRLYELTERAYEKSKEDIPLQLYIQAVEIFSGYHNYFAWDIAFRRIAEARKKEKPNFYEKIADYISANDDIKELISLANRIGSTISTISNEILSSSSLPSNSRNEYSKRTYKQIIDLQISTQRTGLPFYMARVFSKRNNPQLMKRIGEYEKARQQNEVLPMTQKAKDISKNFKDIDITLIECIERFFFLQFIVQKSICQGFFESIPTIESSAILSITSDSAIELREKVNFDCIEPIFQNWSWIYKIDSDQPHYLCVEEKTNSLIQDSKPSTTSTFEGNTYPVEDHGFFKTKSFSERYLGKQLK
jgi:hypothetical protein